VPAGLSGVTEVGAGDFHSLALKSDGTVVAWGDNSSGQATVPAGLSGVTQVAAGGYHSLALDAADPAHSVVTVSAPSVTYGSTATVTLQVKDSSAANLSSGGLSVAFALGAGTSGGTLSAVTDHHDGTYTATFTATAVGSARTITATLNGAAVTTTLPTVTVTKANAAIGVTPYTSTTTTYDGTPHTATDTATGVLGEGLSGLNLSGTTHTSAGTYPGDAWTFTDTTGHYNNASGTVTDSIAQAPLTITAKDVTIIQGEALPTTDTVRYNGFVPGEGASALGGTLLFSTTAPNNNTPGTFAIKPVGLTSSNYDIHFVSGTLTVLSWSQATTNLQGLVDNAQPPLGPGMRSSLDDQLQAALASFAAGDTADGVSQLGAFIHHVSAQQGQHIDTTLAHDLITSAQRIIDAVG
jgi:hypothetical protein